MAEPSRPDAVSAPASSRRGHAGVLRPLTRRTSGASRAATTKLFGSHSFFRLWLSQVVSSLGDWIGFFALTALAARVGGSSPEGAISLVLAARVIPGFFLAPVAGVLVDRWHRKTVMVGCDVGRGVVLAMLPFVDTVQGLFLASLLLEIFTLMWSPAKEASVPNLVPPRFLTTANSLSLVAAYGTFPLGSALFAFLVKVAEWLGRYDSLRSFEVSQVRLALWFDVGTFFVSAVMISTLALPRQRRGTHAPVVDLGATLRELREGWRFIVSNRLVRSVIVGIATGLIGGGMLVPLGPRFSSQVLGGGPAGFGLLLTALGSGVAMGIAGLSVAQHRLPHERMFVASVLGAGVSILAGASMSSLTPAVVLVAALGLCAGAVYVLGFTILQTNVDDELRGRIFATLYTVVRLCLLLSFTLAPILSSLLDGLAHRLVGGEVEVMGITVDLPGARLTLWVGGLIILLAGLVAARALRGPAARADQA